MLPGDLLTLGAPRPPAPAFTLTDGTPPVASARHAQTGVVRAASAGLIVLPDEENPLASLVEEDDGSWAVEAQGVARRVSDRETIVVEGEAWILDLPQRTSSTVEGGGDAPSLATIALRFAVSRNEERVDLTVVCPGRDIELPARSHNCWDAGARGWPRRRSPAERGGSSDELGAATETRPTGGGRARKQFAARDRREHVDRGWAGRTGRGERATFGGEWRPRGREDETQGGRGPIH